MLAFKVGDKVKVKNLKTLLDNGDLKLLEGFENVYFNHGANYTCFDDFAYFDQEVKIKNIDEKDKYIPYFVDKGVWLPEFMLTKIEVKEPEIEVKIEPMKVDEDQIVNKFNGKPFGKMFRKLISLDPKIAEFSDTRFQPLKRHELQYIARLLMNQLPDVEKVDLNKTTNKDLAIFCYNNTLSLM